MFGWRVGRATSTFFALAPCCGLGTGGTCQEPVALVEGAARIVCCGRPWAEGFFSAHDSFFLDLHHLPASTTSYTSAPLLSRGRLVQGRREGSGRKALRAPNRDVLSAVFGFTIVAPACLLGTD